MAVGLLAEKVVGGRSRYALYVTEAGSYLTHPPETDRTLQAKKTLHTADFIVPSPSMLIVYGSSAHFHVLVTGLKNRLHSRPSALHHTVELHTCF